MDRDGVINRGFVENGKSYAPRRIEDFKLLPYVKESIKKLINNGFLIIIVTNQPDISNGLLSLDVLHLMHNKLRKKLAVTDIYFCPHSKNENCECRMVELNITTMNLRIQKIVECLKMDHDCSLDN